jgi:hypothetical protein
LATAVGNVTSVQVYDELLTTEPRPKLEEIEEFFPHLLNLRSIESETFELLKKFTRVNTQPLKERYFETIFNEFVKFVDKHKFPKTWASLETKSLFPLKVWFWMVCLKEMDHLISDFEFTPTTNNMTRIARRSSTTSRLDLSTQAEIA